MEGGESGAERNAGNSPSAASASTVIATTRCCLFKRIPLSVRRWCYFRQSARGILAKAAGRSNLAPAGRSAGAGISVSGVFGRHEWLDLKEDD
jgi:hypothetical protein